MSYNRNCSPFDCWFQFIYRMAAAIQTTCVNHTETFIQIILHIHIWLSTERMHFIKWNTFTLSHINFLCGNSTPKNQMIFFFIHPSIESNWTIWILLYISLPILLLLFIVSWFELNTWNWHNSENEKRMTYKIGRTFQNFFRKYQYFFSNRNI